MRTTSGGGDAVGVSNADLARRVRERCRLTGRFVLRSGRVADEYFDKYQFEAGPPLLAEIATAMAPLVPAGTQVLAGLEMGGIAVVAISAGHLRDATHGKRYGWTVGRTMTSPISTESG
jgi:orotate phosphoribosyltransferase